MNAIAPRSRRVGYVCALLFLLACRCARADDERINRGGDPFFQISHAVPGCPAPLGPLETEAEWNAAGHYRIERGNSCWWEGRCRLSNSYLYDKEIADSVKRRLSFIERSTHWKDGTTLWLTLQRRFIIVQGCLTPGFDKSAFLAELAKTADVERVIDETTSDPKAPPPYGTSANPIAPVNE